MSTPQSNSSKRSTPGSAFSSAGKAKSRRRIIFNRDNDDNSNENGSNGPNGNNNNRNNNNNDEVLQTANNAYIQIVTPDPALNFDSDKDYIIYGFTVMPMPGKANTVCTYPLFMKPNNRAKAPFFETTLAHNVYYPMLDSKTGQKKMYKSVQKNGAVKWWEYKGLLFTADDADMVTKANIMDHINNCVKPAINIAKRDNQHTGSWKLFIKKHEELNIKDMEEEETVVEVHYWKDVIETDDNCVKMVHKALSLDYAKNDDIDNMPSFKQWCAQNSKNVYQIWRRGQIPTEIIETYALDASCMHEDDWKAYVETLGEDLEVPDQSKN